MHEFELIKKYFKKLSTKSLAPLNLNDDVFFDKKNKLVVSVDTYTEGNHFINFTKPELVIKKIIRSFQTYQRGYRWLIYLQNLVKHAE